ncbi:peptidoglycan-binding protein [Streptomyces sp. NPDC058579]|uniref:peptidoglycan-binding domain-containing protein n=1 Tax=Streptomyces sp. NPDC058579 TaxID=3346548 RepID=UPI003666D715
MQIFPTLKEGTVNPVVFRLHVQTLQRALVRAGFDPGPVGDNNGDLVAGSKVATAARAFQAANGLAANGTVGPETWEALPGEDMQGLPTLAVGSQGGAVSLLQRVVRDSGFDPGPISGVLGLLQTQRSRSSRTS